MPNKFVGVWLKPILFNALEKYVKENGYSSKSELLRALIRKEIEK